MSPLTIAAPDRPALDAEWLVSIGSVHVGTRTHVDPATWIADLSWIADPSWISNDATYLPAILNAPEITRESIDAGFGWTQLSRFGIRIANPDGAYDALWDARGQVIIADRYDRARGITVREFEGLVDTVTLDPGSAQRVRAVEIEGFNQDLTVLETMVPKRLTSTTLFGATCPNPGATIPKVVGTAPQMPLIYVRDDVPGARFEYLVGEGTYTVTAVYRDRIGNQQPQPLQLSEYTLATYDGLSVIRTARRQLKGGGGFHQLYADVSGPAAERNLATFAGLLMGDTTWGAGLTVDGTSVIAAAATVPGGLVIDGVLREARPAREWLQRLLELRGGRPTFHPVLGWGLRLDTPPATAKMLLRDEPGPGERTMLAHGTRRRPGLNDDVKTLRVEYAPNLLTGQGYLYETSSRTVSTVGAERRLTHDLLRDRTAADIYACYRAKMLRDPDVVEGTAVGEEGRQLAEHDVINVISTPLQLAGVDRKIIRIRKGTGRQEIAHRRWDPADYTYDAGTLPPLQTTDNTTTPPPVTGLATVASESGIDTSNDKSVSAYVTLQFVVPDVLYISALRVDYRQTGSTTYGNGMLVSGTPGALTSVKIAGLTANLSYDYRVVALNGTVESTAATLNNQTAPSDSAPAAPTSLAIESSGASLSTDGHAVAHVVLSFTVSTLLPSLSGTRVEYRRSGSSAWGNGQIIRGTGPQAARIDGLTPGFVYDYSAVSLNGTLAGIAATLLNQVAPGDTTAPGAAGTPTLISQSLKTAVFAWTASADLDVKGYNWQLHTGANGTGSLVQSGFTASRTREIVGASYTTYHFRVQPVDHTDNAGSFTSSAPVTLVQAATPDLGPGIVTNPIIAPGAVSELRGTGLGATIVLTGSFQTLTTVAGMVTTGVVLGLATVAVGWFGGGSGNSIVEVRIRDTTTPVTGPSSYVGIPVPAADVVVSTTPLFLDPARSGTRTFVVEARETGVVTGATNATSIAFVLIELRA